MKDSRADELEIRYYKVEIGRVLLAGLIRTGLTFPVARLTFAELFDLLSLPQMGWVVEIAKVKGYQCNEQREG